MLLAHALYILTSIFHTLFYFKNCVD